MARRDGSWHGSPEPPRPRICVISRNPHHVPTSRSSVNLEARWIRLFYRRRILPPRVAEQKRWVAQCALRNIFHSAAWGYPTLAEIMDTSDSIVPTSNVNLVDFGRSAEIGLCPTHIGRDSGQLLPNYGWCWPKSFERGWSKPGLIRPRSYEAGWCRSSSCHIGLAQSNFCSSRASLSVVDRCKTEFGRFRQDSARKRPDRAKFRPTLRRIWRNSARFWPNWAIPSVVRSDPEPWRVAFGNRGCAPFPFAEVPGW